jgi:plasmid stabilization system protein ParE
MSLTVKKASVFIADFEIQYEWYWEKAGLGVAERNKVAVNETLQFLARHPAIGRLRSFRHPRLKGLRSFQVQRPFHIHLVFYRFDTTAICAERIMHGARDLPRRLAQPPGNGAA